MVKKLLIYILLLSSLVTNAQVFQGASSGSGSEYVSSIIRVAAPDSYLYNNGADYNCNNTSDQVEIMQALERAATDGISKIKLYGHFEINDTIHLYANYDGIEIDFGNREMTSIHSTMSADIAWFYFDFENDTLSNFTVKNMYIDGKDITGNTSGSYRGTFCSNKQNVIENLTIEDCTFESRGGYNAGVSFSYQDVAKVGTMNNLRFIDNEIIMHCEGSTGIYGFRMTNYSDGLEFTGNTVNFLNPDGGDNNFNPIAIYGSAENFTISGNRVYAEGQIHSCIAVSPGRIGTIVGNITYMDDAYSYEAGIELEMKRGHTGDVTDSVQHVTISGNTILSNKIYNVGGRNSVGIIIRDYDTSPDTIYPTNISISGNSISNCDYGVRIEHGRNITFGVNSYYKCGQDVFFNRTDHSIPDTKFSSTHLNGLRIGNEQLSLYDTSDRTYKKIISISANQEINLGNHIRDDIDNKEVLIGIDDTVNVIIKGRIGIEGSGGSAFVGYESGKFADIVSTNYNSFFGYRTGFSANSQYNVGFGAFALDATLTGSWNTALGASALSELTSGTKNVGAGFQALLELQTGSNNMGFGYRAMYKNTSGSNNTSLGAESLFRQTSGNDNTAVGAYVMKNNITGVRNTAVGTYANQTVYLHGSGNDNCYFGYKCGESEKGSNNTMMGAYAGDYGSLQSLSGLCYFGYNVGINNTSSNRLMIDNSSTNTPLIDGDFSTNTVTINDVMRLAPRPSDPGSPSNGFLYYNSTTDKLRLYSGGSWVNLN